MNNQSLNTTMANNTIEQAKPSFSIANSRFDNRDPIGYNTNLSIYNPNIAGQSGIRSFDNIDSRLGVGQNYSSNMNFYNTNMPSIPVSNNIGISWQSSSSSNNQNLSLIPNNQIGGGLISINSTIPRAQSPVKYYDSSPGKAYSPNKIQFNAQPYRFYQPSQAGSQSSLRFPSETNLIPAHMRNSPSKIGVNQYNPSFVYQN